MPSSARDIIRIFHGTMWASSPTTFSLKSKILKVPSSEGAKNGA